MKNEIMLSCTSTRSLFPFSTTSAKSCIIEHNQEFAQKSTSIFIYVCQQINPSPQLHPTHNPYHPLHLIYFSRQTVSLCIVENSNLIIYGWIKNYIRKFSIMLAAIIPIGIMKRALIGRDSRFDSQS